jgi:Porin subfamily
MEVEMKMVRSLLLGTAAGLVAVAGAQAADMPVKAAAVQYVKICNLYGDGFYYLPGTSICVKMGGYVRGEYGYLGGANMTNEIWTAGNLNAVGAAISNSGPAGYNTRWDGNDFIMRSRAYISMDTRQQSEYGVIRTYLNIGLNYDSPAAGAPALFSGNRAFIQFAGFTVGLAQSFFDFYSIPASSYWGTIASDTGDGGWKVAAFTASFGNGITSTLSLEEPRRIGIVDTNVAATLNPFTLFGSATAQNGITGTGGSDSAKIRFPDMVYAFRIDQVWGSAQVMFAAHDASAAYYYSTTANGGVNCPAAPFGTPGSILGSEVCGHPADKLGWAAGAGFRINVPNTNGSYFQMQYTHTLGATRYMFQTQTGHYGQINGGTIGFGWLTDGIVNNLTGGVDLTRVDGLNAAFDYHWSPRFWTSLYGTYAKVYYDQVANASICTAQNLAPTTAGGVTAPQGIAALGGAAAVLPVCANDWTIWQLGSRWQYNFTPALYAGVDVMYNKLNTADSGGLVTFGTVSPASASVPTQVYQVANQSSWWFRFRVHRDILP